MMNRGHRTLLLIPLVALTVGVANLTPGVQASESRKKTAIKVSQDGLFPIYKRVAKQTDEPWTLLAAIDRYAQLTKSKEQRQAAPYYGFAFYPSAWSGLTNPNQEDYNPSTIQLFGGLGQDGNGDGLALPWDPADRIATMGYWLDGGSKEEDEESSLWVLLQDPVAMDRISAFARLFQQFGTNMNQHCFPIAKRYNYSVKHSFGAGRSYGGARRHEGVDIFAGYGTPVLASAYSYVELMGWNRFGGWRIGLRDATNTYYYYAHMSSYVKGLKQGDLVRPGQVIGYVGSSGYGPPGTSGRFPPHLHFGLYRDFGRHEWAYSPSGSLSAWERLPQRIIDPSGKLKRH